MKPAEKQPDILGYVLQMLEPDEERAIEEHLETTPTSRRELLRLRPLIQAMQQDDVEPSKELIYQTLRAVASQRSMEPSDVEVPSLPASVKNTSAQLPKLEPWAIKEYEASPNTWRRADAWALIAVVTLILLAIPPVLQFVRDHAAKLECRDNMRQFYSSFTEYMNDHHGAIPALAVRGPESRAGIYATTLREAGLWGDRMRLGCPPNSPCVPQALAEVQKHPEEETNYWQQFAGNYAYHLGYTQEINGKTHLVQVRRGDGDMIPILADRPARFGEVPGWASANSPNHGGQGQNVLLLGGAVMFLKNRSTAGGEDVDIYRNELSLPYAGKRLQDNVLGASEARPVASPTPND